MKEIQESRKTRYTKLALQDSLMELMREKPISKITIKALCLNADINRTTFYAHYTDQYDLLRQIEEETLSWARNMIAKFPPNFHKPDMMQNLVKVLAYIKENKNHIQVLMSEQGDIDFPKKLLTTIYEQCGLTMLYTQSTDSATRELYFIFVVTGSVGLIQHWLKNGLADSPEDLAEIIYTMTVRIK